MAHTLPGFGIKASFVNIHDLNEVEAAIKENTRAGIAHKHGLPLGGIIVDAGKFDWAVSGKYPAIAAPNPSYHGVSFVNAAGPAAFVTYIRAILLRDTGASIFTITGN